MGIVVTLGSLHGVTVTHCPWNARGVRLSPVLGTVFAFFIAPMTVLWATAGCCNVMFLQDLRSYQDGWVKP